MIIHILVFLLLWQSCFCCTTLVVGKAATVDGSVMSSHSNDGAGDSPGNIRKLESADWPPGSQRKVQGGFIPQVPHTFAYLTEGYSAINEFQVGMAESTCNSVLVGNASGLLNIVDLSAIALERANTSRAAILVMGSIAERYGYNDAGESLLVTDPNEAFIFHILPDSTKTHAIWIAQRVPDNHVAVVANAFVIRSVNFNSSDFLYSQNIMDEAKLLGWDPDRMPFEFTRIFSGPENGHKYSSGRRMWMVFTLLSDVHDLNPEYPELISSAPYPPTLPVTTKKISHFDIINVMRNQYEGTPFDMTKSALYKSGGPFATSDRWIQSSGSAPGSWERTISLFRTIVSYVLIARNWLPPEIGAMMWVAPHAAHTSCYVPFPVGIPATQLPKSFTDNQFNVIDRGVSYWQAARLVFNMAQLRYDKMIIDIKKIQNSTEAKSFILQKKLDDLYIKNHNITEVSEMYADNAKQVVKTWWDLSDNLFLNYADGYCNSCGSRVVGYPDWWLEEVNYQSGPPPAPPVPPLH